MRYVLTTIAFSCLLLASARGQELDKVDLPVLPPNHPMRQAAPAVPVAPERPPTHQTMPPSPTDVPTFFGEPIALDGGALVYVLDFSSSMGVVSERVDYKTTLSRWDVVVREARRSVLDLAPSVSFDMVVFGTQGGCGVSIWKGAPVAASDANKAGALVWLNQFTDALLYGGATPTGPAVVAALQLQPEVIVLLTDGQPSACGLDDWPPRSHRKLIQRENQGTRIDVFGIDLPTEHAYWFSRGVASDSEGMFIDLR